MNVGAVESGKGANNGQRQEAEFVASAGAPKGLGAGKGAGQGGGAAQLGKGKGMPPGACRICWQQGHYGRDCPFWKPPKGGKKGYPSPKCEGKSFGQGACTKGRAQGDMNYVSYVYYCQQP